MDTIQNFVDRRKGFRKFVRSYTLFDIASLLSDEAIDTASFNRDEVKSHKGNDVELLKSILIGWSVCMFLAFWDGVAYVLKDIKPTKMSPLYVTEGGHRLRWVSNIVNGEVKITTQYHTPYS